MNNIGFGVSGQVKIMVVDSDGRIVSERPWQKNLILDQGMTGIGTRSWANSFLYAVAGTGSVAPVVGNVGLGAEVVRTNNYVTGVATCGYNVNTSGSPTLYRLYRTFDFPVEVGPITYRELGFSWAGVAGNNLFSRVVLQGAPVALLAGQRLRVGYTLTLEISPAFTNVALVPFSFATITGAGSVQFKSNWAQPCLDAIDVNGNTFHQTGVSSCMEPSSVGDKVLADGYQGTPGAFPFPDSGVVGGSNSAVLTQVVGVVNTAGVFTLVKEAVLPPLSSFNSPYTIGRLIIVNVPSGNQDGMSFVFTSRTFVMGLGHTFSVRFTYSWTRSS